MADGLYPLDASAEASGRARLVSVGFYAGFSILLLGIVAGVHKQLLPAGAASNIGNNSESYFFALVLALWIQYVRPRLSGPSAWKWTALAAIAGCSIGLGLLNSDLPSRIATLQEPALALGLLIPYVTLRRPLPAVVPRLVSGVTLMTMVVGVAIGAPAAGESLGLNNWVVTQAETLGFILLLPIALDIVDRGVLDSSASTHRWARRCLYVALAAIPMLVIAVGNSQREGDGVVAVALNYIGRIHESFIGVLLVVLYFAVGLGRRGRPAEPLSSPVTDLAAAV